VGIEITVLGSGSAGNCTYIQTETTSILVDVGFSCKQITERLSLIGKNIQQVDALLLTHEHSDHTRGITGVCKSNHLPVYANRLTAEAVTTNLASNGTPKFSWRIFSTGSKFEINDLVIETFSVPHDAYDPVGYTIMAGDATVGVLTDLGHVTRLVMDRVQRADVLVVESNHDVKLLQQDVARPWATKQRIMSRHGHLNNDAAAALVEKVARNKLRHVFLAHLSQDCNRPELAQRAVTDSLRQSEIKNVTTEVVSQKLPSTTYCL